MPLALKVNKCFTESHIYKSQKAMIWLNTLQLFIGKFLTNRDMAGGHISCLP
jgi:hypothetical protein